MAEVVNNDKLELILTKYGADRIAEALDNPDMNLAITKIRIGSGDNDEYYELPTDTENPPVITKLKGDLGYEFYILDKQLLEDNLTISFHTIITEDIGGFDIREVGLYESTPEGDKLFAIATQQPFVKPSPQDNYFISLNYYIFLKAQNFAELYDRITLDVEHAAVTEPDLESLMKTFLFAQENLMAQIGKNTELLGYNRPTQLLEKINENKTNYSYITLYKNFASVLDLVQLSEDIFSYWIFDYSRRESLGKSIVDLSNNQYYLSTNKLSSLYPHSFKGFQSMFNFKEGDYYKLSSSIPVSLYNPETDKDSPFTMVFVLEPNDYTTTRTLLAKSDKQNGQVQVFEVQEMADMSLQVTLYSSSTNYITFVTAANSIPKEAHSIVLTYDPEAIKMKAFINSAEYELSIKSQYNYTHMNTSAGGTFYEYYYIPETYVALDVNYGDPAPSGSPLIYNEGDQTIYCTAEGNTIFNSYPWYYNGANLMYANVNATVSATPTPITYYAWVYDGGADVGQKFVYTKQATLDSQDIKLYDRNFNTVSPRQDSFHIVKDGNNFVMKYGEYNTTQDDTYSITRYVYKCECPNNTQYIYTTTNNIQGLGYPLYTKEGSVFELYTGTDWTFQTRTVGSTVTYVLCYDNAEATLNAEPVTSPVPDLASYIINESGQKVDFINSKVGIISIIKEKLSDADARILALNLCATLGQNPFLSGS